MSRKMARSRVESTALKNLPISSSCGIAGMGFFFFLAVTGRFGSASGATFGVMVGDIGGLRSGMPVCVPRVCGRGEKGGLEHEHDGEESQRGERRGGKSQWDSEAGILAGC